jgi:DNA-binding NtrC family response regulator
MNRTEPLTPQAGLPTPVLIEVLSGRVEPLLVTSGTYTVGSSAENDLVLDDRSVSARHARIEVLTGAVRVTDLGSTNGTVYLGARVNEALIPVGGEVKLGRSRLRFSQPSAMPVSRQTELGGLLAHSEKMQRVLGLVEKVAPTSFTVLVSGETGSGKEAVARAIHVHSPRAAQPFVVFDAASASQELIESALFGHVKGAFTGASDRRVGFLEASGRGTLFIDEIGELPLDLQPKLLRALDRQEFLPVGDSKLRKMECRVIASTHLNLQAQVKEGKFRGDLYFRITQSEIHVPPLRERREDILPLAQHFAREYLKTTEAPFALSPATQAALLAAPWPGNVRELRHSVERALAVGQWTEAAEKAEPNFDEARDEVVRLFEREYLTELIKRHSGNLSAVAREAGMPRTRLYRLLEHAGLRTPSNDES